MNKYYSPLRLSRLHHAEFYQLLARMSEDFKAANLKVKDEDYTRLFNTIKTTLPTLQAAIESVRGSEHSQTIHELDRKRAQAFQALASSFKPFRYSTVDTEKQAYQSLMLLFNHYKGVTSKNYEEETSLVTHLLTKLNSSDYQPAVTTLGLTRFVTALSTAQTAFEAAFAARSKEQVGKVTYNVNKIRKDLTYHYLLFIDYVGVLSIAKSDPFYKQSLSIINNSRKYYADIVARRSAKEKENNASVTFSSDTSAPE